MSDEFRMPPAERREPKRFEPPPWERDAFEELARRREQQEADEAIAAAVQELGAAEEPTVEEEVPPQPAEAPAAPEGGQLDETKVAEMLAQLAASEPSAKQAYSRVAIASSLFVTGIGSMLVIWGMAALVGSKRSGQVAMIGGAGLMFFGALFVGVGVWVGVRTLRQRGVL